MRSRRMRRRRMRSRCPFDASNIAIKAWQGRRIGPLVIQIDSIVTRRLAAPTTGRHNFALKSNKEQQEEQEEQVKQVKEDFHSCHPD